VWNLGKTIETVAPLRFAQYSKMDVLRIKDTSISKLLTKKMFLREILMPSLLVSSLRGYY
jgi:hypothetical protein